jgi:DNA-binding transcriptional MerR regulator
MQAKTTRAFRTISEAGEELGLQPHVLRFWESKFADIKPVKRGGGRRFYRPEDIEFLRGIKILLHDEKHPIKDVQKLIKKSGASRVAELGRSVEKAAKERPVSSVELVPERIVKDAREMAPPDLPQPASVIHEVAQTAPPPMPVAEVDPEPDVEDVPEPALSREDTDRLRSALNRLERLRDRWADFDARRDD